MNLSDISIKYGLNKNQISFLDLVDQKKNIFLFGKAGTGKSHVVKALKEYLGSKVVLTASTGIAALNIGGMTFHRFLGVDKMLNPVEFTVNQILKNQEMFNKIKQTSCLLIDEISMFSNKPFLYLDAVFKKVKNDSRICGGVQIIVVGDYMQLPYVDNKKQVFDKSSIEQIPAYESSVWKNLDFHPVCLDEIMRQKGDLNFINDLNFARFGMYSPNLYNVRSSQSITLEKYNSSNLSHIIITSENATVDKINEFKYSLIEGKEYEYKLNVVKGDLDKKISWGEFDRIKPLIKLKVGTQVIIEQNISVEKGLVNGTKGVVVDFSNGLPIISYGDNLNHVLEPFDFKVRHYNEKTKQTEEVLHIRQLPVSLSYAITVNRSQGLTFDKVIINIGYEGLLHKGKIYTSLSRCKSYDGLLFMNFPNRQKNSYGTHFAIDFNAKDFLEEQERLFKENFNF